MPIWYKLLDFFHFLKQACPTYSSCSEILWRERGSAGAEETIWSQVEILNHKYYLFLQRLDPQLQHLALDWVILKHLLQGKQEKVFQDTMVRNYLDYLKYLMLINLVFFCIYCESYWLKCIRCLISIWLSECLVLKMSNFLWQLLLLANFIRSNTVDF